LTTRAERGIIKYDDEEGTKGGDDIVVSLTEDSSLVKCAFCGGHFERDEWSDVYCSTECERLAEADAVYDFEMSG